MIIFTRKNKDIFIKMNQKKDKHQTVSKIRFSITLLIK